MPIFRVGIQVVFAQLFDNVNEKPHRINVRIEIAIYFAIKQSFKVIPIPLW